MTEPKPNLILIGLRASGKSTLGRQLSQKLARPFVDLDDSASALLESNGPGEAIEKYGIGAFRDAESQALKTALDRKNQILALGGGTPTAPGCADMLRMSSDRVIYLRALPKTLEMRLASTDNSDRPALVGEDVFSEVQALFDQRDTMYQALSETVIHTDGVSQDAVMSALIAILKAGL
jgi:shikimate kinase